MGNFLTYLIYLDWIKNIQMSTLVFDIAQFFPSLNHYIIPFIPDKAGFNARISLFFSDYLVGRKT